MKRPLLKPIFSQVRYLRLKSFLMLSFALMSFSAMHAQATFSSVECHCLDNATTATNGQYRDSIIVTSGVSGQIWRVQNPVGFYNMLSPAPPAAPILLLNNTIIPEVSPGRYALAGKRISGVPWTVTVTNGVETLTRSSTQSCSYPSSAATTISGQQFPCPNSTMVYSIPSNALLANINWSLTGGGTITGGQGTNSITIQWGASASNQNITVSGTLASYAGQPQACAFTSTHTISITDTFALTRIIGDFGNCIGAQETYTLEAAQNQLTSVTWTVMLADSITPSGIPATGSLANSKTIQWPAIPGDYVIRVSGQFRPNTSAPYCSFTSFQRVNIVNEPVVPLACVNTVNMSLNPDCQLSFAADFFLQDQAYPNSSYDIMLRDLETGQIIPPGTLGMNYINKIIEYKVIHECSGNSCWGYARLEDKSIPDLNCPPDITINCTQLGDLNVTGFAGTGPGIIRTPVSGQPNTWILTGFDKCSPVTLTYQDQVTTSECVGPFSSIITRTWRAVDNNNNVSTCTQIISVNRGTIQDLMLPGSWDNVLGPNPSLEACDNYPVITEGEFAGNPHPDLTGRPMGIECLKASVSFTDIRIPICGQNSYKVRRRWQIINHCAEEDEDRIIFYNQFITVMDTKGPVITCPADLLTQTNPNNIEPAAIISAGQFSCGAEWPVLPPTVIFECSRVTWDVEFLLADSNGLPPVNGVYVKQSGTTRVVGNRPAFRNGIDAAARPFRIENLPAGRTWIRYTVIDECDNFTYCFTEVDVVDQVPPTPVCDRTSNIAIAADGMAWVGVQTFNDGSHDNCALDYLKVRRMENNLVSWASLDRNNTIKFTCDDIGKDIMVELGVWDKSGNSNSCMVTARVQDNIPPTIIPPADRTANCTEDFTSLTRFGAPTVTDNCTFTVVETMDDQRNECGVGRIVRIFTATDSYGNVSTGTQNINVLNNNPFSGNSIIWPVNVTLTGCSNTPPLPEAIPQQNARRPRGWENNSCQQISATYEDIVFQYTEEACVKILRQWTVIDWCQRNPFIEGSGTWTRTQVIMINNTVLPTITFGCLPAHITSTQVGTCQARVQVTATGTDDCTAPQNLKWSYTIDEGNNNTVDFTGTGPSIDRVMSYGTHRIVWSVRDECNNVRTCTNTFTIVDDKKPTPYCISEIVTVIMPTSRNVTIWASDFDLGATDNCSTGNQLRASFSPNVNDISRTITCEMMTGRTTEFTLTVYITDAQGNNDFCTVRLRVQDNSNACGFGITDNDPPAQSRIAIRGSVYTDNDDMVSGVEVQLHSNQPEFPKSVQSAADGKFLFENLPLHADYSIVPKNNKDPMNGVSTLDLVMIQRHILGIQTLDSPYKLIAADVNNSQKITASDLVDLRKVILGILPDFPNNTSWRFVDVAHIFQDPTHPWPFAERSDMPELDHNLAGVDFIAVKVGDVNGNAKVNNLQSNGLQNRNSRFLAVNSVTGKAGDVVLLQVSGTELNQVLGAQLGINFDPNTVEWLDIQPGTMTFDNEHISYRDIQEGSLKISWNSTTASDLNGTLFNLTFRLKKDVQNARLVDIHNAAIPAEVYLLDGNTIQTASLQLRNTDANGKSIAFELYQNMPNPFNSGTVIGFNLPEAGKAVLKVFDIEGKLRYQTSGQFVKGYNSIQLDRDMLQVSGIMYYQLDTDTHSATRKMIVIE